MELKRYFKKEKYKHYVLCSIPFIIMIPIYILQKITMNEVEQSEEATVLGMSLIMLGVLFFAGITLISIEVCSYNKYKKMLFLFRKDELARINEQAKISYNMGKILITNDVVIFFGFFNKKVIPTNIIESVKKVEETYIGKGRGLSISIDYKNIILKCKSNKQVIIPAPKNYNYTECESCKKIIKYIIDNKSANKKEDVNINSLEEASAFKDYKEFRVSNIMGWIVAVPYLLVCLLINSIIKINISSGSSFVLKFFYSAGIEDFLIFIELLIYTIVFIIIHFYFKVYNRHIVKGNTILKHFKIMTFFLLVFLNWIFIATDYDYKKEVRSDYVSYLKNECETYTGKVLCKDYTSADISWSCYYNGKITYLVTKNKEFVSTKGKVDEDKIYKITYLPKTHLIVTISEENMVKKDE